METQSVSRKKVKHKPLRTKTGQTRRVVRVPRRPGKQLIEWRADVAIERKKN